MSEAVSSETIVIWDEKTINQKGLLFLDQKKQELKSYQDLWNSAQQLDDALPNNKKSFSKVAVEKLKISAEESCLEIKNLENVGTKLLELEFQKNPLSDQSKQLAEIVLACSKSLDYFTKVANYTCYKINLDSPLHKCLEKVHKVVICTTFIGAVGCVFNGSIQGRLSYYAAISCFAVSFFLYIAKESHSIKRDIEYAMLRTSQLKGC